LTGSASWNSSNQTNSPYVLDVTGAADHIDSHPYGSLGSTLAESPPFQGKSARPLRVYMGDYQPFVRSACNTRPLPFGDGYVRTTIRRPYTTYDAFAAVSKDAWTAQLYCENFTDTRPICSRARAVRGYRNRQLVREPLGYGSATSRRRVACAELRRTRYLGSSACAVQARQRRCVGLTRRSRQPMAE